MNYSPFLCPKHLNAPSLNIFCCSDSDYCNGVTITLPPEKKSGKKLIFIITIFDSSQAYCKNKNFYNSFSCIITMQFSCILQKIHHFLQFTKQSLLRVSVFGYLKYFFTINHMYLYKSYQCVVRNELYIMC